MCLLYTLMSFVKSLKCNCNDCNPLQVNGDNLLTLEYERETHSETIYNRDLSGLLTVRYNSAGQPTHFIPYGNVQVLLSADGWHRLMPPFLCGIA